MENVFRRVARLESKSTSADLIIFVALLTDFSAELQNLMPMLTVVSSNRISRNKCNVATGKTRITELLAVEGRIFMKPFVK